MTDPNILIESTEIVLSNSEQILINIEEGKHIIEKLSVIKEME